MDLTPEPNAAFIYVHDGIDEELIYQLVTIGYPVAGVILAEQGRAEIGELAAPVVDHRAARSQLMSGAVPDMIVAAGTPDDPARAMAAYLAAEEFAPARTRLLHPAATIPYFRVTYPGNFACAGFPGAGNVIIQAILTRIQELSGLRHDEPFQPFCARLARNHGFFLRGFINQIVDSWQPVKVAFGQGTSHRAVARVLRSDGAYIAISELPYCSYIGCNFGGHTLMTDRIRMLLEAFGFWRVRLVRDPVRLVVSNAAKFRRPASLALNDRNWLENICQQMHFFEDSIHKFGADVYQVRFEHLLLDPVGTILACASALNMPISSSQAAAIWDDLGFSPLTPAGREHFHDPTAERSAGISQEILKDLEEFGIRDLCERLGYGWFEAENLPSAPRLVTTIAKHASPLYGYLDTGDQTPAGGTGVTCTGSDPSWTAQVISLLNSGQFSRFYRMLGTLDFEDDFRSLNVLEI